MTTWVNITNAEIASGQLITNSMMLRYRDNMRALAEDDASVPAADTIKRLGRQNDIDVGHIGGASRLLRVYGAGATYQTLGVECAGYASGFVRINNSGAPVEGVPNGAMGVGSPNGIDFHFITNGVARGYISSAGALVMGTDPGGSALLRVGGSVSIRVPMTWPAANAAGALTNDGSGNLAWSAGSAVAIFWARIINSTVISITATTPLTADRLHYVTGTAGNYDIPLPAAPAAGTVVGVTIGDWAVANKAYRLDAGAGVVVCGRTRYLALLHTNVALLYFDGTKWLPLVLNLDTPWVDAGAITITAVATNPTKGTISKDKVYWARRGDRLLAKYIYHQTTAGTAGSGDYLISLPIGAFSSLVELDTGAWSLYPAMRYLTNGYNGNVGDGTSWAYAASYPYGASTFRVTMMQNTGGTSWVLGPANFHLGSTTQRYNFNIEVPMQDW